MDAVQTCEIFLSNLKRSNLNFSLIETPFAVEIKIKKTFIKERSGLVRFSGFSSENSSETKNLHAENRALRAALASRDGEIDSLKKKNSVVNLDKAQLGLSKTLSGNLVKAENAVEEVLDKKLTKQKT